MFIFPNCDKMIPYKTIVCFLIVQNSSFFLFSGMWVELSLLFLTFVIFCIMDATRPKNFPPGPRWWPLVGNLLLLLRLVRQRRLHPRTWQDLSQQYGPIVGVRLGRAPPIVVVTGPDAVLEVLHRSEFDGRVDSFLTNLRTMGKRRGVMFTDGEAWLEHKSFLLRTLRDCNIEALILEEAMSCMKQLRAAGFKNSRTGVPMHEVFSIPILNILWRLIAGVRCDNDLPTLAQFTQYIDDNVSDTNLSGGILSYLPQLRYIAPRLTGFTTLASRHIQLWTFFSEKIWEHKNTLHENYSRDLIDVYLKELQSHKKDSSTFTEMQLVAVVKDFFAAGAETTMRTLSIAIAYMMANPHVQCRVQQEIDRVVGYDRPPCLEDRNQLPYVNAVIMEVQRCANVAEFSVSHRALKDTMLSGYAIPRDTTVIASLWSVHMDRAHWGDPEVFRPERFIDREGRLQIDPWFIPFGAGRRQCLGMSMSQDMLLLVFTVLLQNLTFSLPPGVAPPLISDIDGFTIATMPFKAVITSRRHETVRYTSS